MNLLFEEAPIAITELNDNLFTERKIRLSVARLDEIHPVISGNKLFKLHYFLEQALQSTHKTILTFGGAYSNHLAATAFGCKSLGLKSIGIVRGERPLLLSHTLAQCEANGMQLEYISREDYKDKERSFLIDEFYNVYGDCLVVPEGGYHPLGAKGASIIMDKIRPFGATHICTAVGTATTLAGLLLNSHNNETIIGIPVLKQLTDINERISFLCGSEKTNDLHIFDEYHFGGYAKKNNQLLEFMNEIYTRYYLPTDFVYTGKMLYAVFDKIQEGFFREGSHIICLHTGGLQGNNSLPEGTLVF
jgi:1-aminocyclopropane-1-carboxylate deaminase/D-cysteine desulfhydrase-like pyridoxal-dependent ACC family enzyme